MAHVSPYRPRTLPLKRKLDWPSLIPELGPAYLALATRASGSKEKEARANGAEQAYRDYRKALDLAIGCRKLDLKFIQHLHAVMMQHQLKECGKFRTKQNWVGPEGKGIELAYFLPPTPDKVGPALRNWIRYMNGPEIDPLVQLAIGFAQLLLIHPFMDGNGRIARLIIPLFIMKRGLRKTPPLWMSQYFKKRRKEYLLQMYAITADGDWEGWIRFFLRALSTQD